MAAALTAAELIPTHLLCLANAAARLKRSSNSWGRQGRAPCVGGDLQGWGGRYSTRPLLGSTWYDVFIPWCVTYMQEASTLCEECVQVGAAGCQVK
jgi:hypothetical protein